MAIAPVEKRLRVGLSPADAFDLFTRQIAHWWPLAQYSCGGTDARQVDFEARVGGSVIEHTRTGEQQVWSTITSWEPPHRFAMTWHPGRPVAQATRLLVEFAPAPGGTDVRVLHDGWEARDHSARDSYDGGWQRVLARFVAVTGENG